MPDPAMITQYLQRRGAPTSAANANRVREHFAANPDQLDRAAMGLPPGLEDRVAPTLDMMLDQQIAATTLPDITPQTQGDANPAPAPSRRGPTTQTMPGANKSYPAPREAEGSPLQTGGIPGDFNAPGGNGRAKLSGSVNEQGMPVEYDNRPGEDSSILKWLLPIFGISAAVPAAENLRGRMPSGPMSLAPPGSPLALPAPQQRITSQVGPNMESVGAEMETIDQRNQAGKTQQRAQVQQSVDAENDAMLRQMEEQARARRRQKGADDTVSAAKRLLRR